MYLLINYQVNDFFLIGVIYILKFPLNEKSKTPKTVYKRFKSLLAYYDMEIL